MTRCGPARVQRDEHGLCKRARCHKLAPSAARTARHATYRNPALRFHGPGVPWLERQAWRRKIIMRMTTKLRALLGEGRTIVAPGIYDGVSARLVEQAGFSAAYASGGAI